MTPVFATVQLILHREIAAGPLRPFWHFSGVFHPAVAHFPIALLILAGLIEFWNLRKQNRAPGGAALTCLIFGALGAVAAAALGWANADAAGAFNGSMKRLVAIHRWLGVAVAGASSVAVVLALVGRRPTAGKGIRHLYRFGVIASAALVALVGSYGGKLTHGVDHYSEAYARLQAELKTPNGALAVGVSSVEVRAKSPASTQPVADATVPSGIAQTLPSAEDGTTTGASVTYNERVRPILESNCVKCHNELKHKGDYRLDTRKFAFTPGASGQTPIIPGDSENSLLIQIVEGRGKYADERMPPKGAQLAQEEIATIRRWIDSGAVWPEAP